MTDENPTPTTEVPATTAPQEPGSSDNGTVQTEGGEAKEQGAPAESFTQVDPNTLTPELRSTYDNMLRDYKSKTAEIAERSRSFEGSQKKAEIYDQISQDEAFVKYWTELSNNGQKSEKTEELITDEEFANAQTSKEGFVALMSKLQSQQGQVFQKRLGETESRLARAEADKVVEVFANKKDESGNLARPDYKNLEDEGLIGFFLQKDLPKNVKELDKKLETAYVRAKGLYSNIYNKGRQEALGRVQQKIGMSSEMPSESLTTSETVDFKKLNPHDQVREAVRLARQKVNAK